MATRRNEGFERILDLILMLTEDRGCTLDDMVEVLEVQKRTVQYYLSSLRRAGLNITRIDNRYHIDFNSPYFDQLTDRIKFSESEVITLYRLLEAADDNSLMVRQLKAKLNKFYDMKILNDVEYRTIVSRNISRLYEAIYHKKVAILRHYSSSNSNTESDRVVEPFMFINGNNEIRAFELTTKTNKTFKVARIKEVELLADDWTHAEQHRTLYTDIFNFSGEEQRTVRLRLSRLACNTLIDEYPMAEKCVTEEPDRQHWLLEAEVCNYKGIGRFVLGLLKHIEILGDEGFKEYISTEINEYNKMTCRT